MMVLANAGVDRNGQVIAAVVICFLIVYVRCLVSFWRMTSRTPNGFVSGRPTRAVIAT